MYTITRSRPPVTKRWNQRDTTYNKGVAAESKQDGLVKT